MNDVCPRIVDEILRKVRDEKFKLHHEDFKNEKQSEQPFNLPQLSSLQLLHTSRYKRKNASRTKINSQSKYGNARPLN